MDQLFIIDIYKGNTDIVQHEHQKVHQILKRELSFLYFFHWRRLVEQFTFEFWWYSCFQPTVF